MPDITLDINVGYGDEQFSGEIMQVEKTFFGIEDHGILTLYIEFKSGPTGQSLGGLAVAGWSEFGEYVKQLLSVFGVSSWEKVVGSRIYVLRPAGDKWGRIIALMSADGTRVFNYEQWVKDHT